MTERVYRVLPAVSTKYEPVRCSVVHRVPPTSIRPWTGMPSYSRLQRRSETDMDELKQRGRELGNKITAVQFTMYKIYDTLKCFEGIYPPCAPNVAVNMSLRISDTERLEDGFLKTLEDYDQWCRETMSRVRKIMDTRQIEDRRRWESIEYFNDSID